MYDPLEVVGFLFLSAVAPIVNAALTVGLICAIYLFLCWRSKKLALFFAGASLAAYIAITVNQANQRSAFQAWLEEPTVKANSQLSLPKSVWIDPGICPAECSRFHGNYRHKWKNNSAIVSLLFGGRLEYVDFGHDDLWRFRRGVGAEACNGDHIPLKGSDQLSEFALIHNICVQGVPIDNSDAELKVASDFVDLPFDLGFLFHRATLSETRSDVVLAEGYAGRHYRRLLPPTLNFFDAGGHGGLWTRSVHASGILAPKFSMDEMSVWSFHRGVPMPRGSEIIEEYGIDEDLILDALRSADGEHVGGAIVFVCHRKNQLSDRALNEIDRIAADPERVRHHLAGKVRQGWCAD